MHAGKTANNGQCEIYKPSLLHVQKNKNDDDIEIWVTAHPDAYTAFDKAAETCAG